MKKFFLIVMIVFLFKNVNSLELLCSGEQSRLQNQKQIFVNCSNRKEVIDILGWGWQKLRQQGIAGLLKICVTNPTSGQKNCIQAFHLMELHKHS